MNTIKMNRTHVHAVYEKIQVAYGADGLFLSISISYVL